MRCPQEGFATVEAKLNEENDVHVNTTKPKGLGPASCQCTESSLHIVHFAAAKNEVFVRCQYVKAPFSET